MPIRRVTNVSLGSITTSRLLAVTSAETIFTIGSGNRAFEATNLGIYNVYYGQSGVLANSGGVIVPSGAKFWDSIVGNFVVYFALATGGVTSNTVIQEYAGN